MFLPNFRKDQIPIFFVNLVVLSFFTVWYSVRGNYEFLAYVGVSVVTILFVYATNPRAQYSNALCWALSFWSWIHLSGSAFYFGGTKLYDIILIPISREYGIFRYDHFVHIVGFVAATLAIFQIYQSILRPEISKNWRIISLILLASGLGLGVANEIVEFVITVLIPENGVGGYVNTSLDHVANLAGIVLALIYIRSKELNSAIKKNEISRS